MVRNHDTIYGGGKRDRNKPEPELNEILYIHTCANFLLLLNSIYDLQSEIALRLIHVFTIAVILLGRSST